MIQIPTMAKFTRRCLPIVAVLLLWGCAHHQPLPREAYQLAYQARGPMPPDSRAWAPVFIVYDHADRYNRIGRPVVQLDDQGRETINIDTDAPVVYFLKRSFQTEKARYTNLIYRIHFPKVPYSLLPFNLTAGKNVGLMVVVTLNTEKLPVLVTTVHTCGCYKAIVPTQHLPKGALPDNWGGDRINVYGEKLPSLLQYHTSGAPRILVHLRPGVHRVMELEIRDNRVLSGPHYQVIPMQMEPVVQLGRLPLKDGTTSFYHTDGLLKGHVKGSVKPLETLFMSLISLDLFVGTDKAYGDSAETGNPFYTSLKPWRRDDSDMWDFARFLSYWGWRL
jgi:hypothetical protein